MTVGVLLLVCVGVCMSYAVIICCRVMFTQDQYLRYFECLDEVFNYIILTDGTVLCLPCYDAFSRDGKY